MDVVQWALLIASGLAGIAGAVNMRRQRRFRRNMARLARRLKLHYTPEDRLDLPARFAELRLMRRGHNRRTGHVMTGATPCGCITCFRLAYEIGSGGCRDVRQWMVALLETDFDLPFRLFRPADDRAGASDAWLDVIPDGAMALPEEGPIRVSKLGGDDAVEAAWPSGGEQIELASAVLQNQPAAIGLLLQGHLIAACSPTAGSADTAEAAVNVVMRFARQARGQLDAAVSEAGTVVENGAARGIKQ